MPWSRGEIYTGECYKTVASSAFMTHRRSGERTGTTFPAIDVRATLEVFEQHTPRDDIAVPRGRRDCNCALLFEHPPDPTQRFIRQIVRLQAIAAIEVRDEPSAHFEVRLGVTAGAFVQPGEQSGERDFRERTLLSHQGLLNTAPWGIARPVRP